MTSASETAFRETADYDYDVAIVGGGPAGCSAGVFIARYGLETVIFDRGRSSIQRCAHLENYLGFPAGIDIETLYGLMHDHAEEAGCKIVPDFVESVDRLEAAENAACEWTGFVVETQEGRRVTARRVVAATRYDCEYVRDLDEDERMYETYEYDGEERERFDETYAEPDGTTPVDGFYVASPSPVDYQAIAAAGRGSRVGVAVVEAARRDRGYPEPLTNYYDWVRQAAELEAEEDDVRKRVHEHFDDRLPDRRFDENRLATLRAREVDRRLERYVDRDEIDRRAERAQRRLLEHVDDELVLEQARKIAAEQDDGTGE